jgi:hypothetical protein
MTYSSLRSERLILTDRTNDQPARSASVWDRITTNFISPDIIAVVLICAVGLLVTLALFLLVPSSRELANSIQQLL